MSAGRILALIVKEMLSLFRDPKGRIVMIAPPLLQLLIFAFAATLEVDNVSLAILNRDAGKHATEIVQRLVGSPTFSHITFVDSLDESRRLVDEQRVMAAIHFAADFSQDLEAGRPATLQVVLDGRRSNAAQIVNGYITRIANAYSLELQQAHGMAPPPMVIVDRNWFNENRVTGLAMRLYGTYRHVYTICNVFRDTTEANISSATGAGAVEKSGGP